MLEMRTAFQKPRGYKLVPPQPHNYRGQDVWALGCTFALLIANLYPYFRGPTSSGTVEEILEDIEKKTNNLSFGKYNPLMEKIFNRYEIETVIGDLVMLD